jgi:hypothetical protein
LVGRGRWGACPWGVAGRTGVEAGRDLLGAGGSPGPLCCVRRTGVICLCRRPSRRAGKPKLKLRRMTWVDLIAAMVLVGVLVALYQAVIDI